MQAVKFFKEFIRHPQWTGTFFASSDTMAEVITDLAELGEASSIIELGSGNGVFTIKIMAKKQAAADFFAMELNPYFAEMTRQACPGVTVYQASALNIQQYLHNRGFELCDVIVSALPWAAFAQRQQVALLNAIIAALRPGGRFVTIAYVSGRHLPAGRRFQMLLKKRFAKVEVSPIVWKNCPPAVVYRGYKAI